MQKLASMIAAVVISLAGSALLAGEATDLKVVKIEIVPNSEKDLKSEPFFHGRSIIEVAPVPANGGERLTLQTYRSYRFIVTVENVKGRTISSLLVKTECIRGGKAVVLGKARIGVDDRTQYACYDVYASGAEPGDYVIRTTVDADKEARVYEIKPLEFMATIKR